MTPLDRIAGYGHVAIRYGLEEAIFLDSIVFWYKENRANNRNHYDGRFWTYNSVKAFDELFPWWSSKQIRRIINSCKDQGTILVGNYNEDPRDRTVWYSPCDELLALYGLGEEGNCIRPFGQMQFPEQADTFAQTGEPLPCNNHVYNTPYSPPQGDGGSPAKKRKRGEKAVPDWKPERFAGFWAAYPRGENRQAAVRAWDKLRPPDELIDQMAKALARQLHRADWQRGVGIPYASTWLNGRRWEDEERGGLPDDSSSGPGQPLRGEGVTYL